MTEELIKVPDIGGAEGAEVVEVLVAPGDTIEVEQSLIVVESDKASMEIPTPLAGVVGELRVAVGDMVSEGDVILSVAASSAPASSDAVSGSAADDVSVEAEAEKTADAEAAPEAEASGHSPAPAVNEPTSVDVVIPDLGSDQGADLVEWLVDVGATVAEGDSLVLLESDKASMEVPSPASGILSAKLVEDGVTVNEGVVIARLDAVAGEVPAGTTSDPDSIPSASESDTPSPMKASHEPPIASDPAQSAAVAPGVQSAGSSVTPSGTQDEAVYAGPAVRKLAREFGVSLGKVAGTGAKGRILKEDLQQYVARALQEPAMPANGGVLPAIPEQDFARFGSVEHVSRSRIDKLTADNMVRSWLNIPHVTQFEDADISGLERFRKDLKGEADERNVRLTPLPFILKACAVALRDHPKLKSSLADNGETLVMKQYCHIGMAVDTPAGLVVPVIRDVDKKSIWELAREVAALAERARDKQLKPDDMQGGVFTVSSLGAIGGRGFTPIINAPEVAILGVGRAAVQPVWDGEVFRPSTMLPLALSYDHRVVNGGDGGRFLTELAALLADVKRMVM
ncbi:MAG: dihydrolipoyllysine-residue acetyltransferase [Halieaceae bacterium]|nr:dihydrolipoyllysine-residue acetyltransferase [Halieaceae bacterium]